MRILGTWVKSHCRSPHGWRLNDFLAYEGIELTGHMFCFHTSRNPHHRSQQYFIAVLTGFLSIF